VRIEDYAILGNCETAALVSKSGSIDWLCWPQFDSGACFAGLLGSGENGFWKISPNEKFSTQRRYRGETMILETEFETNTGAVRLTDFMPVGTNRPTLIRIIEGLRGEVQMHAELAIRFDYGSIVPWFNRLKDGSKVAIGGPDALVFNSTIKTRGENLRTVGDFTMREGETQSCSLVWYPSHMVEAVDIDISSLLRDTEGFWQEWISKSTYRGEFEGLVKRSLLTLKALTFAPTGGIVAAPTTSLPEEVGSSRNWDYRYCWLRDSTFTLYSLLTTGFLKEAEDWRRWLVRAVAGTPSQVNIMYGIRGERRLDEVELKWLDGFERSKPVRIGNAAYKQRQLDIFGELMDTLHLARRSGLSEFAAAWDIQKEMIRFVIETWREPDEGIWEVRGGKQHFTHSKVMAWVALDRAVKAIENFGLDGHLETWKKVRDEIKADVFENGIDRERGCFTQSYGSNQVDSSLLQLPVLGFIAADDPIMVRTVKRIEAELMEDGILRRYRNERVSDGVEGSEGKFLACSFWLADYYVLAKQEQRARDIFIRLVDLTNDVGLLAEEYDTVSKRQIGNFPQALSHIALINTAVNLCRSDGSARHRSNES
jgi:GH15 family glucan-1,4-alpha-glucosidase